MITTQDTVISMPEGLKANPDLDTWVRIDAADTITVFTGKVELGQGIIAALARIAAEELDVAPQRIRVETADTAHGLDEWLTAGSMSLVQSGASLRQAAAEARAMLLELAAAQLEVQESELIAHDGTVREPRSERTVTYWELLGGRRFARRATGHVAPKPAGGHTIIGSAVRNRADVVGLVTGTTRFVQDLAADGMVHGRIVRPPAPAARLTSVDAQRVHELTGVIAVVCEGDFLGVVADREEHAARAAEVLRACARWSVDPSLPGHTAVSAWLKGRPDQALQVIDGAPCGPAPPEETGITWTHEAEYTRPYIMHGAIGPSAALAVVNDDRLTVWTHSQGVYLLRRALADVLEIDLNAIRVRHVVGPGCYGHNGADDAALDAALLARAVNGRPVLLKWSRADEHQWEPYGPPAVVRMRAVVEDGKISRWSHDVWSTTHLSRPTSAGGPALLGAMHLDRERWSLTPRPVQIKEAGMHRNAAPIYDLAQPRIIKHFIEDMPLRTSSLRSLGAYANVFAIESFMDELAAISSASPVEIRLRHLSDPRAREVLTAALGASGWDAEPSQDFGIGTGMALARYKGSSAYAAVVVRLRVDDRTAVIGLERIWIAADCGEVVDPSGAVNQLEGGAIQSASWTLKEQVRFNATEVTSIDWDTYPILRFSEVPRCDTVLVNRPGEPFLGVGEATQAPTAAAIANAVHDAVGLRLRHTPFTPARVRDAALDL